mgnify:CR=1 FL=1
MRASTFRSATGRGPSVQRPGRVRALAARAGFSRPRSLFWLVLLPAASPFLASCATVGQVAPTPTAEVTGVEVGSLSLTELRLDFAVDVKNPYTFGLPVLGLDYALSTGGKRFLQGEVEQPQIIPASSTGKVILPISIPVLDLVSVLGGLQSGKSLDYTAELGLKLDAPVIGALRLPVLHEGKVNLP